MNEDINRREYDKFDSNNNVRTSLYGSNSLGEIVIDSQWNYILYDADDSQPDYIGLNRSADASQGDTDWKIYKFIYTGSNTTSTRVKTGSWTGRVALFA